MHECVLGTVDTDALVLKHQTISIHSDDWMFLLLDQFHTKYYIYNVEIKKWIHI